MTSAGATRSMRRTEEIAIRSTSLRTQRSADTERRSEHEAFSLRDPTIAPVFDRAFGKAQNEDEEEL